MALLIAPQSLTNYFGSGATPTVYTSNARREITCTVAADVTALEAQGCQAHMTVRQGTNAKSGTFVCNGTSAVTIANTLVEVGDVIAISLNTVGGTVGAIPHVDTITGGTGFTIKGTASDTSTYSYAIIKSEA